MNQPVEHAVSGEEIGITLRCQASTPTVVVDYVALSLWTAEGVKLFHIDNTMRATDITINGRERLYACKLPRVALPPGIYFWNAMIAGEGRTRDHVYGAANMEVLPGDFFGTGHTVSAQGGLLLMDHDWTLQASESLV
jgi:hypothetical protein